MRCNKIKISIFLLLLILFTSCNETENEVILDRKQIDENTLEFNVDGITFRMKHVLPGNAYLGLQNKDPYSFNYINYPENSWFINNFLYLYHVIFTYDFWIAETEVTQELWEKVMGYNNSYFKEPKNPVENINFYEIATFFMKLNNIFNYEPTYVLSSSRLAVWDKVPESGEVFKFNYRRGFRLPLDYEWEYTARGGQYLDENEYLYAGSNIDDIAWYQNNSNNTTHTVGQKKANKLGLYDMTGNVFEFTNTCAKYHLTPEPLNEIGYYVNPLLYIYKDSYIEGQYQRICGGAYNSDTSKCFLAYRINRNGNTIYMNQSEKSSICGFRILLINSNIGR
ncbi:MAG: formylglycine-generating enzyme family protein [Bacteroidetes bacterium]|nr:formylglycine-generating enzyme family protein [Bacteroidota bacterium]